MGYRCRSDRSCVGVQGLGYDAASTTKRAWVSGAVMDSLWKVIRTTYHMKKRLSCRTGVGCDRHREQPVRVTVKGEVGQGHFPIIAIAETRVMGWADPWTNSACRLSHRKLGEPVRIASLSQAFPGLSRETWLVRINRGSGSAARDDGVVVRADPPVARLSQFLVLRVASLRSRRSHPFR